jgi:hypothetical protein
MSDITKDNPSGLWYLVPIIFGIVGGVIMFFALRRRDYKMAKNGLIVGIVVFIITSVVPILFFFSIEAAEFMR